MDESGILIAAMVNLGIHTSMIRILSVELKTTEVMMTDNEINNLVYLCLKYIAGFPMRTCDFQLILAMHNSSKGGVGDERDNLASALSDYIWDHLLGEPDEPSSEEIKSAVVEIFGEFFKLPDDVRNSLEESTEKPDYVN